MKLEEKEFCNLEIQSFELCNNNIKKTKARKSLDEFAEIYSEVTGREYITTLYRPDWSAKMSNAKIRNKIKARKELDAAIEVFLKNGGVIKKI